LEELIVIGDNISSQFYFSIKRLFIIIKIMKKQKYSKRLNLIWLF